MLFVVRAKGAWDCLSLAVYLHNTAERNKLRRFFGDS